MLNGGEQMKNTFKVILVIFVLLVISFVSFSFGRYIEKQKQEEIIEELKENPYVAPTFYATIDDITGDSILVTGLECNDINHRGKYYFNVDEGTSIKWRHSDISINELKAGDVISIAYTGRVMETAPVEIEKVLRIELLDDELNLPEVDPWIEDISLSEAEEIAGFKLELPDVIADAYVAVEYRAIEKEVIEATYVDEEYTVIIKRAIGVNQNYIDNSVAYTEVIAEQYEGNLSTYDITYFSNEGEEIHTIINGNGYTWTIYAPNGYWGDSAIDFIHEICE